MIPEALQAGAHIAAGPACQDRGDVEVLACGRGGYGQRGHRHVDGEVHRAGGDVVHVVVGLDIHLVVTGYQAGEGVADRPVKG